MSNNLRKYLPWILSVISGLIAIWASTQSADVVTKPGEPYAVEVHDTVRVASVVAGRRIGTALAGPAPADLREDELPTRESAKAFLTDTKHAMFKVKGDVSDLAGLTDLQVDLLRQCAAGYSNAEIARRRCITEGSVEKSIHRLMRDLGMRPSKDQNPRVLLAQAYLRATGSTSPRNG